MRHIVLSGCLLLGLLVAPAAHAQTRDEPGPMASGAEDRLDQLFADLKRETNEAAARRIARRIRAEWTEQGGATADLLIERAREAASDEKFNVALDLLDQAVVLYPDYVESWNSRALVYLMMQDFRRSMSDLSHVLAIEPRHFGALTGLAGILRATGRDDMALDVYRRALEIYPMQRSAQRAVINLTEEETDERL